MKILLLLCVSAISASVVPQRKISSFRQNVGPRIIGGEVARSSQFPFVAAIISSYGNGNFFCGGAVIDNQWILTAAQCIAGAQQLTIQLGSARIDGDDPNRVTVATASYVIHPLYDDQTLQHDIALVRLRLPIDFNQYITAISLPDTELSPSAIVTAVGWGQDGDQNPGLQSNLLYVELVTITNTECQINYGDQVIEEMVCVVGPVNEGICTGDSGGPLIEYKTERTPVHAAVATFVSGEGCESTLPSGFTRTYRYLDWIRNVTGT